MRDDGSTIRTARKPVADPAGRSDDGRPAWPFHEPSDRDPRDEIGRWDAAGSGRPMTAGRAVLRAGSSVAMPPSTRRPDPSLPQLPRMAPRRGRDAWSGCEDPSRRRGLPEVAARSRCRMATAPSRWAPVDHHISVEALVQRDARSDSAHRRARPRRRFRVPPPRHVEVGEEARSRGRASGWGLRPAISDERTSRGCTSGISAATFGSGPMAARTPSQEGGSRGKTAKRGIEAMCGARVDLEAPRLPAHGRGELERPPDRPLGERMDGPRRSMNTFVSPHRRGYG